MQIIGMMSFFVIWLLLLWLGSIALEATGMERSKARFQALSSISNTGFTTREAESIVNHPKRRTISSWLIFLGNVGITAFLVFLVLWVKAGTQAPSLVSIIVLIIIIAVVGLFIGLGIVDKLSSAIVRSVLRGRPAPYLRTEEVLHQAGGYGIARLVVSERAGASGPTLGDSGFVDRGLTILAIERGDTVLPFPKAEERVLTGDCLLCYGKVADMSSLNL